MLIIIYRGWKFSFSRPVGALRREAVDLDPSVHLRSGSGPGNPRLSGLAIKDQVVVCQETW